MSNSVTIMLLPSATYKRARPQIKDPHLTVAYFGKTDEISARGVSRLRSTVEMLARTANGPIKATASGVGIFDAGQDGFAVVDLIDGIGTFGVRAKVETLFGPSRTGYTLDEIKVNHRHGFTPHITRKYLDREDDFYAVVGPELIDNVEFSFDAIGLWVGDERYEISL